MNGSFAGADFHPALSCLTEMRASSKLQNLLAMKLSSQSDDYCLVFSIGRLLVMVTFTFCVADVLVSIAILAVDQLNFIVIIHTTHHSTKSG